MTRQAKSTMLTFRVTEAEAEAIRKTAEALGRSAADVIRRAALGVAQTLQAEAQQDRRPRSAG